MPGWLSTHVLDTANGCPAAGMLIGLFEVSGDKRTLLKAVQTNPDGRVDEPLLTADEMKVGVFELVFQVGAYFKKSGTVLPEPAFLDAVPIRFAIADITAHYHVPLLVSPWAYSTYRGS